MVIFIDVKVTNKVVIRSADDIAGNRWKVADFGISTATISTDLLVTKEGRGTAHYCAPEILLSQPDVPSYTNKVDIWGLGVILYEICTSRRAFDTGYRVIRYFWNEDRCPQVSLDDQSILSLAPKKFNAATGRDLQAMWNAALSMKAAFPEFVPDVTHFTETIDLRLQDINGHIAWLLQTEPTKRPSIDQVCFHMGANSLRKQLESSVSLH